MNKDLLWRSYEVLCFGSANLDHVYKVDHFTVPGETQGCLEYNIKCGGKRR